MRPLSSGRCQRRIKVGSFPGWFFIRVRLTIPARSDILSSWGVGHLSTGGLSAVRDLEMILIIFNPHRSVYQFSPQSAAELYRKSMNKIEFPKRLCPAKEWVDNDNFLGKIEQKNGLTPYATRCCGLWKALESTLILRPGVHIHGPALK